VDVVDNIGHMANVLLLTELRVACDRLLRHAEAIFGPEIDLDSEDLGVDFYRCVETRAAYTMVADYEINIGSLVDDLETLQELKERPDDEVVLWHDLEHLRGLLGYLGFLDLPR
jgi:hypothetical protein